jgi:hypothetical protein
VNAPTPAQAFEAETADRVYADIHDVADDVRSLAVSLREAAWRRDQLMVRILRAEFRRQVGLLLGLTRDVAPLKGELAGADKRNGRRAQ